MKERQYSFQTGQRNSFGVTDIVIFVATLSFSAGIGVFYAIKVRETYFQFFLVDNIATFLLLLLLLLLIILLSDSTICPQHKLR